MTYRNLSLAIAMTALLGSVGVAWANGGAFFADEDGGAWQQAQKGTVYFGDVKDARGNGVAGATVTIAVPQQKLIYQIRTDAKGHYRTGDVGLEVDPKSVQLSVAKPDYRPTKTIPLTKDAAKGDPIETDFVVEPAPAAGKGA